MTMRRTVHSIPQNTAADNAALMADTRKHVPEPVFTAFTDAITGALREGQPPELVMIGLLISGIPPANAEAWVNVAKANMEAAQTAVNPMSERARA
jgi:hypothetical protein